MKGITIEFKTIATILWTDNFSSFEVKISMAGVRKSSKHFSTKNKRYEINIWLK